MTSRSLCTGLALSMLLCLGPTQLMAAISLDFVPVDNSAVLTGYTTYDVLVTTDADWTAAAMLFELSEGSLYQHAQGLDSVADPAVIPTLYPQHPGVAFDTYVIGSVAGGGGDIGMRSTQLAFDTQRLDVTWYNLTPDQVGTTTVARLTLTDDTAGSLSIILAAAVNETVEYYVEFVPGTGPAATMVIEEEPEVTGWQAPTLPSYTSSIDWLESTFPSHYLLSRDLSSYTDLFVVPRTDYWEPREPRADLYGYSQSGSLWKKDTSLLSDRHATNRINSFFTLADGPTLDDALPEPGTLTLIGLGTCTALLRRR